MNATKDQLKAAPEYKYESEWMILLLNKRT